MAAGSEKSKGDFRNSKSRSRKYLFAEESPSMDEEKHPETKREDAYKLFEP